MKKDFFIKNMVCDRCIKVVREELEAAGFDVTQVELGKVTLQVEKEEAINDKLNSILTKNGFSLLATTNEQVVEKVKVTILSLFKELPLQLEEKLSEYLSRKLHLEYSKISKLFSYTEKITIEKYFIKVKIEKVKELIQVGELNFTQISQLLDYSNVNHLSSQFKNETGMSLTKYKAMDQNFRNPLDQIV